MLAGEIERRETVARLEHTIAIGFEQIVKQLHVELVVLNDENRLRLRRCCCRAVHRLPRGGCCIGHVWCPLALPPIWHARNAIAGVPVFFLGRIVVRFRNQQFNRAAMGRAGHPPWLTAPERKEST